MPKRGTKIFCPSCKQFAICRAVSPTAIGEPKAQRWHRTDHQDISWFRRARQCLTCDQVFLTAELDERLLEELIELREKLAKKNQIVAARIRSSRPWLVRTETVPLELAQEFVRNTAWWHTHSSGQPVMAPNHAKRIYSSSHGWSLDFGANTFLVGKAIARCSQEISSAMDTAVKGHLPNLQELTEKIELHIRGAVSNSEGYEYDGYYPVVGDDMMFGAQSIDVKLGAKFILEKSGIKELLAGA